MESVPTKLCRVFKSFIHKHPSFFHLHSFVSAINNVILPAQLTPLPGLKCTISSKFRSEKKKTVHRFHLCGSPFSPHGEKNSPHLNFIYDIKSHNYDIKCDKYEGKKL